MELMYFIVNFKTKYIFSLPYFWLPKFGIYQLCIKNALKQNVKFNVNHRKFSVENLFQTQSKNIITLLFLNVCLKHCKYFYFGIENQSKRKKMLTNWLNHLSWYPLFGSYDSFCTVPGPGILVNVPKQALFAPGPHICIQENRELSQRLLFYIHWCEWGASFEYGIIIRPIDQI